MCQIKLWWSYILVEIPLKPSFHVLPTSRFSYMSTNIQVQPSNPVKTVPSTTESALGHLSYYVALLHGICWGGTLTLHLGGPTPLDPAPWSCLILSKFIILLARLTDVLSVWSWKCWKTDSFWKVEVFMTIGWIATMNSETRSIASGIKDLLLLLIFSNFVKLMPAYCWGSRSLLLQ